MYVYKQTYNVDLNNSSWMYKYMRAQKDFGLANFNLVIRCEIPDDSEPYTDNAYRAFIDTVNVYVFTEEIRIRFIKKIAMIAANFLNTEDFDCVHGTSFVRSMLVEFSMNPTKVSKLKKGVKKYFNVPAYYKTTEPYEYAIKLIDMLVRIVVGLAYNWTLRDEKYRPFQDQIVNFLLAQPEWTTMGLRTE